MKTKNKGKIFLAILAIAIIASMLLAGTYAWFVQTAGSGATAKLQAAFFELRVDEKDPEFGHINHNGEHPNGANAYKWVDCVDPAGAPFHVKETVNGAFLVYPGDAVKFVSNIQLDHNREVLVKVDFTQLNIAKQLEDVLDVYLDNKVKGEYNIVPNGSAPVIPATVNDILYARYYAGTNAGSMDTAESLDWQVMRTFAADRANLTYISDPNNSNIFYVFVKSTDDGEIVTGLDFDLETIVGIKGCPFNQNYFMGAGLEFKVAPIVTAVQATDEAIFDVFPEVLGNVQILKWLRGLGLIHDDIDSSIPKNIVDKAGVSFGSVQNGVVTYNASTDNYTATRNIGLATGTVGINGFTFAIDECTGVVTVTKSGTHGVTPTIRLTDNNNGTYTVTLTPSPIQLTNTGANSK
jgi:hypothetical protein